MNLTAEIFSNFLETPQLLIMVIVSILIGMAKTGVHGAGMMSVPILASVFGGQVSSGVMLPLLILADVAGVWYYHRHASWKHLKILFPWAAIGVIGGTMIGSSINDYTFKMVMSVTILVSVFIMILLERYSEAIPEKKSFGYSMGVAAGFTSMVGNLANSVMAVYLLSVRLPKNIYIGTTAWFFLVINLFKLPFHVFVWNTIERKILVLDLMMLPFILVGAVTGIWIVKKFSDKHYRWFIILMTVVSAVFMLVKA